MTVVIARELEERLFFDVPEVARLLRRDPRTVRAACARGEIPATRAGQRWRIPASWLRQAAGLEKGEAGH
jgi:excisionase family DNA binding protein